MAAAALAVAAVTFTACGGGNGAKIVEAGSSGTASGRPLVFGIEANLVGTTATPQVPQTIQAYFDDWNRRGGYKGRSVRLEVVDAGTDPTTTAAGAQKLINSDHVLAMVGNVAPLGCTVSAALIESSGVPVVANSNDNVCYTLPHVFPVRPAPMDLTAFGLSWAVSQGAKRIAMAAPNLPTVTGPLETQIRSYLAEHGGGAELVFFYPYPLAPTAVDADGFVARLKAEHIDTAFISLAPGSIQQVLQASENAQYGVDQGVRFVGGTSTYDPAVARSLGALGEGIYAGSGTIPLQEDTPAAKRALAVLQNGKVSKIDGWAAFSYDAAALLETALDKIDGPVTRESIYRALISMNKVTLPLSRSPYDYSQVPSPQNPRLFPRGGQMVILRGGRWEPFSDWIVAPR